MGRKVMQQFLSALLRARECRFGRGARRRASDRGIASDRGMTTSEYAVGTIAACAFAAVLYKVVTSGAVQSAMQSLIKGALDASF
ncbi:DUF4244 domain-containing protein [Streptomyces sp. NPDC002793]|uniref:DUF4244 domain-containing protein n=1 Tax=Streptomyces sp. NPDC002793 TaxID=3154432 RepID=UPI00332CF68F